MRLSLPRNLSLPVAALAVALAFPTTAEAAGIIPRGDGGRSSATTTFPFLRWLHDSAVEAVFGKSSGADSVEQHVPSPELYTRHRDNIVVRFNVTTSEEERALAQAAQQMLLDVWAFTPEYVDIRVRNVDFKAMLRLLPKSLRQPSILIPDVAAAAWATFPSQTANKPSLSKNSVDAVLDSVRTSSDGVDNIFFKAYQPLSVITRWMGLMEAMFPSLVQMISIGKSYEGRDVHALRVGARVSDNSDPVRKTILVTGGLHGREWISTSTVTYLMWSAITAYGKEPMITKLLDKFDIVFIPVLNPDGYEYTWQTDRLWRKSRQKTKTRMCHGFDLDHTFGYAWEKSSNQVDPCSESYGGESPFQAVEASALAEWAKNETQHAVQFVGFLDLHSYSQQILFPYTYSCSTDPPNLENLMELGVGLAKAIRLSSGESYSVDSACEGAVASSSSSSTSDPSPRVESGGGSAIDWFYHELGARYSYQIKLRDTGSYGFLLPAEHIIPTGEEMLNALKYFGDFLLGNNGIEKGSQFSPPSDLWRDLRRRTK
ncbi:hypothetical protein QBC35DRAFT_163519 [Podospora australis]|uniref:Inactive metallocarboxypeptidase ECM14 n=1 Tax=Podospora australis TaxID=1536484 RepID=A0AAN7ANX6_9PEZI|nr:hypothetical protein QBC35DRAFT_163519 [Podospora australis]